jgi:hypothetical protein
VNASVVESVVQDILEVANRRYTWNIVAEQYFELLGA